MSIRYSCLTFAASAALAGFGEAPAAAASGTLSVGTGATFATNFKPGGTATASGALTATDTNASWTLTVKDSAAGNAGHMAAAATGCSGSDTSLSNRLSVQVTSPVTGVTSVGSVSITGSDQTVASATTPLLAASVLTTNYTQVIPSTEMLRTGCVYTLTATYTLQ